MKILIDKFAGIEPAYCWRDDWVTKSESMFSILLKFGFLNALTVRYIAGVVLRDPMRSSIVAGGSVNFDLNKLELFDVQSISNLLGLDIEVIESAFANHSRANGTAAISAYVRYCPRCMQSGFHAAIFQCESVVMCPIHAVDIVTSCVSCGQQIPYRLNHSNFRKPYCCPHCEQDLAPKMRGRDVMIWELSLPERAAIGRAIESTLRRENVLASAENVSRELAFHLHGVDVSWQRYQEDFWRGYAAFGDEIALRLDDVSGEAPEPENANVVEMNYRDNHAHFSRTSKSQAMNVEKRVPPGLWLRWDKSLWELIPLYKSIRRWLWRKMLGQHRKCAINIAGKIWWRVDGEATQPVCSDAFAFLLWRMSWEGTGTPQSLFIEQQHAPYGIVTWLSDTAPICPENWSNAAKSWLTSRVFAIHCAESYLNYVWYANVCRQHQDFRWTKNLVQGRHPRHWSFTGGTDEQDLIRFFQEVDEEVDWRPLHDDHPIEQHLRWNESQVRQLVH